MDSLKVITLKEIIETEDDDFPTRTQHFNEDFEGTVLDILKLENVPDKDKLWIVPNFLSDKQNRIFAVWCAREALKLVKMPDSRSVKACDVAERYANGEATKEELEVAEKAARDAIVDVDENNEEIALFDAADAAAQAAADAAWATNSVDAALGAASYAAQAVSYATEAIAEAWAEVAEVVSYAAKVTAEVAEAVVRATEVTAKIGDAAWATEVAAKAGDVADTSWDATRNLQVKKLIEILENEGGLNA